MSADTATPPSAWTSRASRRGGRSDEGYEFSRKEDRVIARTATAATAWGALSVLTGVIALVGALVTFSGVQTFGPIALGIVQIVVGVSFLGSAGALRAVVEAEGSDIPNLMSALRQLGSAFIVQVVGTLIVIVGGIIAGILMA